MAKGSCLVAGCLRLHYGKGYCQLHYDRVRRTGEPGGVEAGRQERAGTCSVAGCARPVKARGYCGAHYQRWHKNGQTGGVEVECHRPAPAECEVRGCGRKPAGLGLCDMHYRRQRKTGHVGMAQSRHQPPGPCRMEGCVKPRCSLGYCEMHYARFRKHGDARYVVHPASLGDHVGYHGLHKRLRLQRGDAHMHRCSHCERSAATWAYDHTDPNERYEEERGWPYSVDLSRYLPLCTSCHTKMDYSMAKRHPT